MRNLFMLGVIPLAALLHRGGSDVRAKRPKLHQLVPGFVLGFAALAVARSIGDAGATPFGGLISPSSWTGVTENLSTASTFCLAVAMAAVGLGTSVERMRRLGLRPLVVGLAAALAVGGMSAVLIRLFSGWLLGARV